MPQFMPINGMKLNCLLFSSACAPRLDTKPHFAATKLCFTEVHTCNVKIHLVVFTNKYGYFASLPINFVLSTPGAEQI